MEKENKEKDIINDVTTGEYRYGFTTEIDTDILPVGLNEKVIEEISRKKGEPEWLLEFRLKAYQYW